MDVATSGVASAAVCELARAQVVTEKREWPGGTKALTGGIWQPRVGG